MEILTVGESTIKVVTMALVNVIGDERPDIRIEDIVIDAARIMHLDNKNLYGGVSPVQQVTRERLNGHIKRMFAVQYLSYDDIVINTSLAIMIEASLQLRECRYHRLANFVCSMYGGFRAKVA